ncbi:MAG TPA: methylated-DNA--[protein]-cysteine S-methyltransferase [bacterium]|nr:methylated-DNA--[protein]-cysteine S-methyltransferase [bacterium]
MIARRQLYLIRQKSALGEFGLIWRNTVSGPLIRRVILPGVPESYESCMEEKACNAISAIGSIISRFLEGEAVSFDLNRLDLDLCSAFQKRVLLTEFQIPRGWAGTYGGLAAAVGKPAGARAVGGALAANPFPIIIPCHRAVRSDGQLGGFQGGTAMKRTFLEMEGVVFRIDDRVAQANIYHFQDQSLNKEALRSSGDQNHPGV